MEDNMNSNDELNSSVENESTISEDAQLDAIADFYKDKPIPEEESETEATEPKPNTGLISRIFKKIKTDTASVSGSINDDEDIHSGSFGMNRKHRLLTTHIITALICIAILSGAYCLALLLPRGSETVNSYAKELRNEEAYKSLNNQYNTISHEVSELRTSNEAKKENAENISNYDNTKAALRSEIEAKKQELSDFNTQISEKRTIIAALDENIALQTPSVITLNAGKYVIGTNIAAGKYHVTGSGTFTAASSNNVSKYNIALGSTSHEVVLEKGDIIKINSTTMFTSVN